MVKKSKKSHKLKLGIAPSLAAAAATCGISKRAVQLAKSHACKAVDPSGRVDCDSLMRWLSDRPEILELAGQGLNKDVEIVLKIKAEREIKEHTLAVRRSQYVPVDAVVADLVLIIQTAKGVLNAGPSALAPQVIGVGVPEAEKILRDWVHSVLTKLSRNPGGADVPPQPQDLPYVTHVTS